jgi:hypothetical protein
MDNTSEIVQENSQDQTVESSDMQSDIFEQVFNSGGEDPFNVKEPIQSNIEPDIKSETESAPDAIEAKDNDSQFQYWQSQADKQKDEVAALRAEMETLKQQPAQAPKETKQPSLVKPEKPVKPADYDVSDALADPDSLSAKYLARKEDYLDNMSDYIMKKDEIREEQMNIAQKDQAVKQQHQDTLTQLQTDFNYTPEQANDFVTKMSSPDSLSLGNLVKLHQLNQPVEAQQTEQVSPQAQQKQLLMNKRQEKLNIPKPIGVQPGQSVQSPNKDTEDKMMDAMLGDFNKRNIF